MSRAEPSPTAMRDQAIDYLRNVTDTVPTAAIILGSGLGGLADKVGNPINISFADIPGFASSTAAGHRGQLILGTFAERPIVAMAGRLHRYEGWSIDQIAFPVAVMAALGATQLIVSNAAGGVNPKLRVGDIVIIRDHINLIGGVFSSQDYLARDWLSRRSKIYDGRMSAAAMNAAVANRFNAYQGTYLATLGPNYETRAEYRMMRRIGADVAGMSTVPEVLAAASLEMRVLGISMVSNIANPDQAIKANHAEVLEAGKAAEVKMELIVRHALACA